MMFCGSARRSHCLPPALALLILIASCCFSMIVKVRGFGRSINKKRIQHETRIQPLHLSGSVGMITGSSITDDDAAWNSNKNNNTEGRQASVMVDAAVTTTTTNTCPFNSRSFPRYRIDVTTSSSMGERGFLWPWQRALARKQLERQHSATSKIEGDSSIFLWKEGVTDGVAAVAALWRIAVNALQQQQSSSFSESATTTASSTTLVTTAAFPDAENSKVIRQWVDLMEWLLTYDKIEKAGVPDNDCIILVSYSDAIDKIPTVTLTVKHPSTVVVSTRSNSADVEQQQLQQYFHETVTARNKAWVKRVLVNLGICPFTKSATLSGQGLADVGVPVGRIAYHTSFAACPTTKNISSAAEEAVAGMCQLQADTWEAIRDMLLAGPDAKTKGGGVSSILLAAPAFDDDFATWSGPVFALLEAGVVVAAATDKVGVVCFHPLYQTPDGSSFPGFGHMHSVPRLQKWLAEYNENNMNQATTIPTQATNVGLEPSSSSCPAAASAAAVSTEMVAAAGGAWQRRMPHATINVLRADQLAAAEGKRSTPTLYSKNILQLQGAGWDELQEALDRERRLELL